MAEKAAEGATLTTFAPITFNVLSEDYKSVCCTFYPIYVINSIDNNNIDTPFVQLLRNQLHYVAAREQRCMVASMQRTQIASRENYLTLSIHGPFLDHIVKLIGIDNLETLRVKLESPSQADGYGYFPPLVKDIVIDLVPYNPPDYLGGLIFTGTFYCIDSFFDVAAWNNLPQYTTYFSLQIFGYLDKSLNQPSLSTLGTRTKKSRAFERNLLENQFETDTIIKADSGYTMGCHKIFLTGNSPTFKDMLKPKIVDGEAKPGIIHFPGMSEEAVKSLINFLYGLFEPASANFQIVMELLQSAERYSIERLKEDCQSALVAMPSNIFKTEDALVLFNYARKTSDCSDLRAKSVEVLKLNSSTLMGLEGYRKLFREDPDTAMDLCNELMKMK